MLTDSICDEIQAGYCNRIVMVDLFNNVTKSKDGE